MGYCKCPLCFKQIQSQEIDVTSLSQKGANAVGKMGTQYAAKKAGENVGAFVGGLLFGDFGAQIGAAALGHASKKAAGEEYDQNYAKRETRTEFNCVHCGIKWGLSANLEKVIVRHFKDMYDKKSMAVPRKPYKHSLINDSVKTRSVSVLAPFLLGFLGLFFCKLMTWMVWLFTFTLVDYRDWLNEYWLPLLSYTVVAYILYWIVALIYRYIKVERKFKEETEYYNRVYPEAVAFNKKLKADIDRQQAEAIQRYKRNY